MQISLVKDAIAIYMPNFDVMFRLTS